MPIIDVQCYNIIHFPPKQEVYAEFAVNDLNAGTYPSGGRVVRQISVMCLLYNMFIFITDMRPLSRNRKLVA